MPKLWIRMGRFEHSTTSSASTSNASSRRSTETGASPPRRSASEETRSRGSSPSTVFERPKKEVSMKRALKKAPSGAADVVRIRENEGWRQGKPVEDPEKTKRWGF